MATLLAKKLSNQLNKIAEHAGLEYAKELVINSPEQAAELLVYLA